MAISNFAYGTITPYGRPSQTFLLVFNNTVSCPTTPKKLVPSVWAVTCSLATTWVITIVFSSSAYLDVSVQRVCFLLQDFPLPGWVVPFGNPRV